MASSRKRNSNQYCNDNEQEQDQDQDEYRITRNNSSGLLHDYPSRHVSRRLSHVQTSCNNGGDMVAESSNRNNQNQVQERIPVIRLKLGISESFIKKIESNLTQEKQENNHQEVLTQRQPPPKMKASNFPAVFLRIGSWNWASRNEGDLMIKFYYGKKKLVWEFLFGSLKKKIEIGWTNVSAINAYVDDDNMGRLEIELMEPPEFYNECKFQPLKHTQWERTNDDFTGGQAQSCKRHTIIFSPGILDEHLEKLLQCDNRLLNLSRQPFPIHNSTFFNTNMEVAYYNHQGTVVPSVQINLVQPITSCIAENFHSNLPMRDVPFPKLDELAHVNERNNDVWEQSESSQIQEIPLSSIMEEDYRLVFDELEPLIPDQQLELNDVDNQKLSEVTTTQNCVEVDSSFKPLEQNNENNSNPSGNEIDDHGNHRVGLLDIGPGFAFMEEITSSSDCGLSYVACADDDISGFPQLQFNDELTIQEQDSWLSSQFNMNGELPLQDSNSMGGFPKLIG